MPDIDWADFRETHLSAVFMAGEYVLKFKKPVRTEFVDFSSLAARDHACEQEVSLNSRLSPDVYLGVARIGATARGPGEPAVVMRRLSDRDQLAQHVVAAGWSDEMLRDVARRIAAFHADCAVDIDRDSPGTWQSVRAAWLRECGELDDLPCAVADGPTRALVRRLGLRYLDGRQELFDGRLRSGQVRDGHGDLRCEHVYLTADRVRIIDCVEFDRTLRVADVISDIAFLAMDLERLSGKDSASALLGYYAEFSADAPPRSLVDFYIAYRALVRAKVSAIRADQRGVVDPDTSRYFELAVAHLQAAVPFIVCVGGLPGAGKTTLSEALSQATGALHLSSDEIRHGLRAGFDPRTDPETWEAGGYTPAVTRDVYAALLDRAATALSEGCSVVLDASWREAAHRELAWDLAGRRGAVVVDVLCQVDEATAFHRLARSRSGYSQAGVRTRARMTGAFAPWPEAHIIRTDRATDASVAQLVVTVRDALARSFAEPTPA